MAFDPDDPQGSALLRRGALRAAAEGTALALGDDTTLTLAKTGTTMPDGGGQEGRVVAWRPELEEVIVVRAPGAAGREAAAIARAVWDAAAASNEPRVRVGHLRDGAGGDGGVRIEAIPLESYVAGVVAAEGEEAMPPVALQALAVAARSYALAPAGRHARDGYDVCDTTHCQVLGAAVRWSRDSAAKTRGLVLARAGTPVAVPYSASCSGVLSSPHQLWGGHETVPTRTGPDPALHAVPEWQGLAPADALLAALREAGFRGEVLRNLRIVARARDGMPVRVALDGLAPGEVDAATLRHIVGRRLGWHVLKSHAWEVTRVGNGYRFTGRGKGHGAGICLRGAAVYADRGVTLTQVLATYVPGAALMSTYDRVTVRVPSALLADAPRLRDETLALLAEARVRLEVFAPRQVTLEVHPTVQAYQRATGRAWWTSASTRPLGRRFDQASQSGSGPDRFRVDVAPRATARATLGALTDVLRHERIHVLAGPLLVEAPAWMAEGLAYAAERPDISGPRTPGRPPAPCPADAEITRPGSLEAMRGAYSRAGGCVDAALPAGLAGWRALWH
jgi:stage II sporulation protein D